MKADGTSSTEDMKSQIILALQNLETVVTQAGYKPGGTVKLTIYTTSAAEFLPHFSLFQDWIAKHGIKQATSLMEVKSLFETLKIEFEATVVK